MRGRGGEGWGEGKREGEEGAEGRGEGRRERGGGGGTNRLSIQFFEEFVENLRFVPVVDSIGPNQLCSVLEFCAHVCMCVGVCMCV